jgi:hypothetical protein
MFDNIVSHDIYYKWGFYKCANIGRPIGTTSETMADECITLKWIFKETDSEDVDWSQVTQEKSLALGSSEYGIEHLGSIKETECINQMCDYQLLNKDSRPWSWS